MNFAIILAHSTQLYATFTFFTVAAFNIVCAWQADTVQTSTEQQQNPTDQ